MSRIRIPADLNDEDVFLSWGPVKLSIRQLGTVMAGFFFWFGVAKYFVMALLGLAFWISLIATMWMPVLAIVIAVVKVRGRTIDTFVGQKLAFVFGARTYVLRDPSKNGVESDLEEDETVQVIARHSQGPRVVR